MSVMATQRQPQGLLFVLAVCSLSFSLIPIPTLLTWKTGNAYGFHHSRQPTCLENMLDKQSDGPGTYPLVCTDRSKTPRSFAEMYQHRYYLSVYWFKKSGLVIVLKAMTTINDMVYSNIILFCVCFHVITRPAWTDLCYKQFQKCQPGHGWCCHLHVLEWGEHIIFVKHQAAGASWPVPIQKQVFNLRSPFCRAGWTGFPRQADIVSSCEQMDKVKVFR